VKRLRSGEDAKIGSLHWNVVPKESLWDSPGMENLRFSIANWGAEVEKVRRWRISNVEFRIGS
jgi:hypothetical protein